MSFREYLKEASAADFNPVLPLRGYVKGNTIEKNGISAVDFFSGEMGAVIMRNMNDKIFLIYTSGDAKSDFDTYKKGYAMLQHDQSRRQLGEFTVIGYVNFNKDGSIKKIEGAKGSDKISGSYTYK